jgi:hypothetical protein
MIISEVIPMVSEHGDHPADIVAEFENTVLILGL